jgi:glutamate 5-kinase
VLGLPSTALRLEESQAAAAVGQIALARAWSTSLSAHRIVAGQVLLTSATPRSGGAISTRAPPWAR